MPVGDEVEEPGEALVEVFGAHAAASFKPVLTLPYQSRFAKCPEVVGKGRFGAVESEPATGMVVVLGFKQQSAHDRQPQRIGQSPENRLKSQLVDWRLRQRLRQVLGRFSGGSETAFSPATAFVALVSQTRHCSAGPAHGRY